MQEDPADKEAVWNGTFLPEALCHLLSNSRFLWYTFYPKYWGLVTSKALQDKIYSFLGNAGVSKNLTADALIQRREIPLAILNSDQTFGPRSFSKCSMSLVIFYYNAMLLILKWFTRFTEIWCTKKIQLRTHYSCNK